MVTFHAFSIIVGSESFQRFKTTCVWAFNRCVFWLPIIVGPSVFVCVTFHLKLNPLKFRFFRRKYATTDKWPRITSKISKHQTLPKSDLPIWRPIFRGKLDTIWLTPTFRADYTCGLISLYWCCYCLFAALRINLVNKIELFWTNFNANQWSYFILVDWSVYIFIVLYFPHIKYIYKHRTN